jgi:hypothetical protein
MKKQTDSYDWASAVLSVLEAESDDLNELAKAAELDPFAGDMSDMDCSGLDLSGQNLSGWDLKHATFAGAKLANTRLRDASLDPKALIEADDWEQAELDDHVRAEATKLRDISQLGFDPLLLKDIRELELSSKAFNALRNDNVVYLGDLVQKSEGELLRTPSFGRKALTEVKEVLAPLGLHVGTEVPGWPPKNIEVLSKKFEHLD